MTEAGVARLRALSIPIASMVAAASLAIAAASALGLSHMGAADFGGEPMALPSALGFAGCATALLLLHRGGRASAAARAMLAAIIGLSALVFAQQVLRESFWLDDTFFAQDPAAPGAASSGRIPPGTAVAFALSAAALLLSRQGAAAQRARRWAQAFAAAALLVVADVLIEQALGRGARAGTPLISIAPMTAILFALLNTATILSVFSSGRDHDADAARSERYAAWVSAGLTALIFAAWLAVERSEWQARRVDTRLALNAFSADFEARLLRRGEALSRLADRWELYGAPSRAQWETEARSYLEGYRQLRAIAMVGPEPGAVWRVPRDDAIDDLSAPDFGDQAPWPEMLRAAQAAGGPVIGPSFALSDGRLAVGYLVPVIADGAPVGFLAATLSNDSLLELASNPLFAGFEAALIGEGRLLTGRRPPQDAARASLVLERGVGAYGQSWRLAAWPTEAYLERQASGLPAAIIGFGLLILALNLAAFLQAQRSFANRARAEALAGRLADTLEHMGDAFITLDRDLRFTFINAQGAALLERDRAELLGRRLGEALPETGGGGGFEARCARAMHGRETVRFVERIASLGKWFEASAHPSGAGAGVAVYFRDITAERAASERLRLLQTAVSRMNDLLVITEVDPREGGENGRIIYVNEAFVTCTGYSREEAIGGAPDFLLGPLTQREARERIREALREKRSLRTELISHAKDGTAFRLELGILPVADRAGTVTHWVAVGRDITERHFAEAALRANEERFRIVAETTGAVIWDWDLGSGSIWWTDNVRGILGHDPAAFRSDPGAWRRHIHPEDRERMLAESRRAIAGDAVAWQHEYRLIHGDGRVLSIVDRCAILRDADGAAVRVIGSLIDATAQRDLEARMRQAQKMDAIGQLTGGVAHDFNNLLTVILGNSEILVEQLDDRPTARKLAELTMTAADRAAELTGRLLAFARKQPLAPQRVDVNALVSGMEPLLRRALAADIEIALVRADDLWSTEIDPGQLENAVLNLAINARDAMPGGGRIVIETANAVLDDAYAEARDEVSPGEYVRLTVSDTGAGMPAEIAGKAFDPFFTTKEVGKGSGLGLSLVYGFAKQSGGHAEIVSTPGEGASIRLYFPRAPRDGAAAPEPAAHAAAAEGGDERILVVEDDAMVRGHLVAQLKDLGYRIAEAASGPEALAALEASADIDLLFTDIMMPDGMNGRELTDAALRRRPGLRVLFTSGCADDAIVRQGLLDPGAELLSKPYRRADLAAKLRKVLDA